MKLTITVAAILTTYVALATEVVYPVSKIAEDAIKQKISAH
jgi:hypothetical protein